MSYPFESPEETFNDLVRPLSDLADSETPFDKDFQTRLPQGKAYSFDKIKDRVCQYRSIKASQKLRSADALLIGKDDTATWYYLIDFKNQRVDNIQSLRDEDKNELMQKAFDSLTVLSMTFGRAVPMREIQRHSTFIVVYPRQDYSVRFTEALSRCAHGQPLWKLDKLTRNGFYAEIRTIHDGAFADLKLPYMP